MADIREYLLEYMDTLPIIDAHTHLCPEEEELATPPDVFTRIFNHYSITTVESAGFKKGREWLKNTDIPFLERWQEFKPFYQDCKESGYVKAALKTAAGLYGISDINDDTVEELNRRLVEANTPGLYHRVLREKCNIRSVLCQGCYRGPYVPVIDGRYHDLLFYDTIPDASCQKEALSDMLYRCPNASTAAQLAEACLKQTAEEYVGIKFRAQFPKEVISHLQADRLLALYRAGLATDTEVSALAFYLQDRLVDLAGQMNLIVCVHSALDWCCGHAYACHSPLNIVSAAQRYPHTQFHLLHGLPWMRDTAVIANQFPNVHLNLVWSHQISPYMVRNSINEWLDLVPMNKISGFGGDVLFVSKTYGALCMAKENIASALALRCRDGMSEEYARYICRKWLYENPVELFRLEERGFVDLS